MNQDILECVINNLKKQVDYREVLEECCKQVVLKYNPYPKQCSLDYFHTRVNGGLEKIHVCINNEVKGVVFCGELLDSDNPLVLEYTKSYMEVF